MLLWTRCAITRCREIMMPHLSIVKTRFAKASLRPRCARHRSSYPPLRLPNRRAGTLSYPMLALDTQLSDSRDGSSSKILVQVHLSSNRPKLQLPSDRVGCQAVPIYGSPRQHKASELHTLRISADRSCIPRSRCSDNRADPAVVQRFLHRFPRLKPTGVHPSS